VVFAILGRKKNSFSKVAGGEPRNRVDSSPTCIQCHTVLKSACLRYLPSDEIVSSVPYAQDTLGIPPSGLFGDTAPRHSVVDLTPRPPPFSVSRR